MHFRLKSKVLKLHSGFSHFDLERLHWRLPIASFGSLGTRFSALTERWKAHLRRGRFGTFWASCS